MCSSFLFLRHCHRIPCRSWRDISLLARQLKMYNVDPLIYTHTYVMQRVMHHIASDSYTWFQFCIPPSTSGHIHTIIKPRPFSYTVKTVDKKKVSSYFGINSSSSNFITCQITLPQRLHIWGHIRPTARLIQTKLETKLLIYAQIMTHLVGKTIKTFSPLPRFKCIC